MGKLSRWTIRTQLLALALAAIAPLAAVVAYGVIDSSDEALQSAHRQTRRVAASTASDLAKFVRDAERSLSIVAGRPLVRALDPGRCDPLIAEMVAVFPDFKNFGTLDLHGNSVCALAPDPPPAKVIAESPWFQEAVRNGRFTVSGARFRPPSGPWAILFALPTRDAAGNVSGLVVLRANLPNLQQRMLSDIPSDIVIAVFDGEAKYMMRTVDPQKWIGSSVPDAAALKARIANKLEGFERVRGVDGVDRVYAYQPVSGTDWMVAAGDPVELVFAPYWTRLTWGAAIGSAALLLAIALAIRMSAAISKPIRDLGRTAVEVANGNVDARATEEGPPEVAAVANEFNRMLDLRARSQAELLEKERRFRGVVDSAMDAIINVDDQQRIVLFNPAAEIMFGYSAAELRGQSLESLIPQSLRAQHHSHVELFSESGVTSRKMGSLLPINGLRRNGEVFPLEASISVYTSAGQKSFSAILRDISERVRLTEALLDRGAGLHRAQLLAGLAHVITGPKGEFVQWSDTLPLLVGVEPSAMPADTREWMKLIHPVDRGIFRHAAIEAGRRNARTEVEYRLKRGGDWIFLHQVLEPIGDHLATVSAARWFNTIQDITERKQAEQKINRLNRVYAVLSGINALIVRVRDRDELFREACRIAVESGGFLLAWIAVVNREANRCEPVAWQGAEEDYILSMPLGLENVGAEHAGLTGLAVRDKKAMIADDMSTDPRILLKQESLKHGYHSVLTMPLLVADEVVAVLTLYAAEVGFFNADEMKLLDELAGDISFALEHIAKSEQANYLAYYDQLTGLANRSLFLERLKNAVHVAGQQGNKFAIAKFDIERLSIINNSLGRHAGDALLRQVAERLNRVAGANNSARSSATNFVVILPAAKGRSETMRMLETMGRACLGEPFLIDGNELRIAAKAGIAQFPGDGNDAETLVKNAEAALKKGKRTGERYTFYTQDLTERISATLTLENKLRQALEKEEFVLHYQPKVDLETRKIVGAEALIRWQSPELGLVPPLKFIPLMEETGMILEVGAWALAKAASDHLRWTQMGLKPLRVAVNVSAIQLRKKDFVSTIESALKHGATPPGIDLEITESLMMEDIQSNIEKLNRVRALGLSIAIDDFGTGYSSLAYLAKLPVQTLKIDRSFVITMLKDPDTMTLVQTIISLAHSLKLKVVAEGVDEEEQAKMLRLLRCDEMQGYLFSRPLPFDAMTALLKR